MNLRRVNDEVFVSDEPIVRLGGGEIAFLKQQARTNARKRARVCAHKTNDDALHEMIIAISASSYIHPHKHVGKSESFHIIEGEVDVVIFNEDGAILDVIELGEPRSGHKFYYRLTDSIFHTLLVRTDFLVVHEVTNGPLNRERTFLAPFAPPESKVGEAQNYMRHISDAVVQHLGR